MDRDSLVILQALIEEAETGSHVGSWTWDLATAKLSWSPHMCRMMGLDPDIEASVERLYELVHEDDLDYVKQLHQGIIDGTMPEHARYRIRRPDGSVRTWMATGRQVHATGEAGPDKPTHVVGVVIDLTERIELERSIDRINVALDDAQELANLGLFTVDLGNRFTTWTRQVFTITGLPVSTRPSPDVFLTVIHPHDRAKVQACFEDLRVTGGPNHIEARLLRPDGDTRYVEIRARLRQGPRPIVTGLMHDITPRRELEDRLRWSSALESTGRLAAGVAHDFNNLLTIIVTNAQELRAHNPAAVDEILSSAEAGATLVQRLLAFGKSNPAERGRINLRRQLEEAVTWIDKVTGDGVRVEARLPDQRIYVQAAPAELHQILLNLATNAKDAMPDGGTLTLTLAPPDGPAPAPATLIFSDDGRGMDEDTSARAFDAFFSTKPIQARSAGLGLSTVYGIVGELGGEVALSSSPGHGTSVRLTFPTALPPGDKTPAAMPVFRAPKANAATILVVEDESAVLRAAQRILERDGHKVLSADRPQAAIDVLESSAVDLVLTDLSMPQGGGRRVADEVQRLQPDVPIVFMTGYALGENKLPGEILAKPFSPDQLKSIVRRVLTS